MKRIMQETGIGIYSPNSGAVKGCRLQDARCLVADAPFDSRPIYFDAFNCGGNTVETATVKGLKKMHQRETDAYAAINFILLKNNAKYFKSN